MANGGRQDVDLLTELHSSSVMSPELLHRDFVGRMEGLVKSLSNFEGHLKRALELAIASSPCRYPLTMAGQNPLWSLTSQTSRTS